MENYQLSLEKAKKELDGVRYMLTTTLPFIKEKRYLIKIFEELYNSILSTIKAVLQYEYLYKRVSLYKDAESNFEVFIECASRYDISAEYISNIRKILFLMKKHKESPVEFVRKEKFVILSDNLKTDSITEDLLKSYYVMTMKILSRAEQVFMKKI